MAKYLWEVSYRPEGAKGILKDGGTKRRQVVEAAIKAHGGKLGAFYFAFGKNDAYLIADVPDHVSVAAVTLVVNASGTASVRTTVLLTPEEIDQASKKSVTYSPPGHQELLWRITTASSTERIAECAVRFSSAAHLHFSPANSTWMCWSP